MGTHVVGLPCLPVVGEGPAHGGVDSKLSLFIITYYYFLLDEMHLESPPPVCLMEIRSQ